MIDPPLQEHFLFEEHEPPDIVPPLASITHCPPVLLICSDKVSPLVYVPPLESVEPLLFTRIERLPLEEIARPIIEEPTFIDEQLLHTL